MCELDDSLPHPGCQRRPSNIMNAQRNESVTVKRDVEAIEIPSGNKITLFKGTEVVITQALGGTYTVMTHQGSLSSITSKDADAIGKDAQTVKTTQADGSPKSTEELVWDQMRTCYDPEIPHNIVDLGLIYGCKISDLAENKKKVDVKMTLTAPGCGMGDWLRQDVRQKVLSISAVGECEVEIVFDPPWDRSRMSPALRREFM